MKKKIITFLILLTNIIAYSQKNCDCNETLEQLIKKVESEYPGYPEKTKDSIVYVNFKSSLIEASKSTPKNFCINILEKYVGFFRDAHLVIRSNNVSSKIDNQPNNSVDIDIEEFYSQIKNTKDSLEGIWNSGGCKIGIFKKDSVYKAFIIQSSNPSWKANEIKFILHLNGRADYYKGNHSLAKDLFTSIKSSIIFFHESEVAFVKEQSDSNLSKEQVDSILNELEGFYLKPLTDKTLLLKISSFGYSNVERIEDIINKGKPLLDKYENLIIDLRGNGGGTDYAYHPILPYIYSNPERHLGAEYFVTQTLVDGLKNWVDNADKEKYADDIEDIRSDLKRMEGKMGKYIPYNPESDFGITTQDSIYEFPKQIAVLVDKGSGSTTESFLIRVKQSKKVKVLGTPTYGVLDYSAAREFQFSCEGYTLYMPTFRMLRLPEYPIDNIGIQPDIYMDKYIKDWVEYAIKYLEN